MAKKRSEELEFVIEEDDEETDEDVESGEMERYEVRIGPPMVSGRKVKPVRSPEPKGGSTETSRRGAQASPGMGSRSSAPAPSVSAAGAQQIFKIEDDLRRTRDIVDDLKHNVGIMEGEVKDLRAEMERISYLLRSLEGLKNAMKDIESTLSELSGLYDLISANVNPFVEIPPMKKRKKATSRDEDEEEEVEEKEGEVFKELSDIFDEDEDEEPEEWGGPDLESEEWALRWTQFLISKVGKDGLERSLDYYRDLEWIDDDLIEKVLEIARGTVRPKPSIEGKHKQKSSWRMDADDHVKSLEFIKKIRRNGR